MSRKSLPKKDQIIWYLCSKCNTHIYAKEREQHIENCPLDESSLQTTCAFIRNKTLVTNQLAVKPTTEDLRAINLKNLNNLLFVHESVFSLCDLVLGDYVSVSSPSLPNSVPITRIIWPLTAGTLPATSVCVSEEGKLIYQNKTNT